MIPCRYCSAALGENHQPTCIAVRLAAVEDEAKGLRAQVSQLLKERDERAGRELAPLFGAPAFLSITTVEPWRIGGHLALEANRQLASKQGRYEVRARLNVQLRGPGGYAYNDVELPSPDASPVLNLAEDHRVIVALVPVRPGGGA